MNKTYSQSKLKAFRECPFRYNEIYNKNNRQYANDIMETGNDVDKAIIELIENLHYINDYSEEVKYMSQLAMRHVNGFENVKEVLRQSKLEIDNYNGIIDYAVVKEDGIYLIDWKSGYKIIKDNFQLDFYAFLLWSLGYSPIKARYVFLRHNFASGWIEYNESDIKRIKHKIDKMINEIENEENFNPISGNHCSTCHCVLKCPINAETKINNPIELANNYLMLKTKLDEMGKVLKGYASEKPIEIRNGHLGYKTTITKTIKDVKSFINVCQKIDEDPLKYLAVDGRKTKNLNALEEFESIIEETSRQEFKFIEDVGKIETTKDNEIPTPF